MRGVISAGAVTALEHLQLAQRFDAVYGVSAGALDSAYMLAGQAAIGTSIYFDDLPAAHFLRARRILAARPPIALDELIDVIVARRKRLDVAAVEAARPEFHVLATCLEHRALERPHGPLLERLRAAARVPLLSGPPVRINGCRLYDGGLLSPLPVELAAADGATHILVLRTRPDGPAIRRHGHVERAMISWLHHRTRRPDRCRSCPAGATNASWRRCPPGSPRTATRRFRSSSPTPRRCPRARWTPGRYAPAPGRASPASSAPWANGSIAAFSTRTRGGDRARAPPTSHCTTACCIAHSAAAARVDTPILP